jgi:hypothetical protein
VSGVLLMVPSEATTAGVHLPLHDGRDWSVNEGKEWLLGRAAALEREYQMSKEADDALLSNGEDADTVEVNNSKDSDILEVILKCGGDRRLEKSVIGPTLKHLPVIKNS